MKKNFLSIFLGSAVGTFAFLLLAFFLFGSDPIKTGIVNAHGFILNSEKAQQCSPAELVNLANLVKKGYVLTTNDLISDVTSFYSGLIQILVVIIAVLGVVAFMYVKGQSETAASKMAIESVNSHFRSKTFHDDMKSIANTHFVPMKTMLDADIQELVERVQKIENVDKRIRALEEAISRLDSDEMENSGGEIS